MYELSTQQYKPLELDENGVCARAAVRECVEHGHEWPAHQQDRASALLKDLVLRAQSRPVWLLSGASSLVLQALLGLVCGIEGRNEQPIYPELRWSNFVAGVVCFRAGIAAPLSTGQFEPHREYLEQLWRGPVSIEPGTAVGAPPGCVVVRRGEGVIARAPLALPAIIPLQLPDRSR